MRVAKFAIIDVETTGGTARNERITEIAIVLHDGSKILDTYQTLINPERTIPWNITQITGITDEMVEYAPKFYEIAKKIVEMTDGAIFVAHNVSFDYSFIREEFSRLGFTYSKRQLCTVKLARKVFPGLPSYSLSNLKKHFNIHAERSHRALDDTLATTQLFEYILAEQTGDSTLKELVNKGLKENRLPGDITLEKIHALPEACGVYYFHDENGDVIYVGKSINIQKRVVEHFTDTTVKGQKMQDGVRDISYEVTGSELYALLFENDQIKKIQPRINRALRAKDYQGCIMTYTDQNGYRCLSAGKLNAKTRQKFDFIQDYPKESSAKAVLQSLARQHHLCFRLCNLDHSTHACFQYAIKKCHGACVGEETPEAYNQRLGEALETLQERLSGSFFLFEKGKTAVELAVFLIRDGQFQGMGFIETDETGYTAEDLFECIQPFPHHPDAARIIQTYISQNKRGLKHYPL